MTKNQTRYFKPVKIFQVATESFKNVFADNIAEKPIFINQFVPSVMVEGIEADFYDYFEDLFKLAGTNNCAIIRGFEEIEDYAISICFSLKAEKTANLSNELEENLVGLSLSKHRKNFAEKQGRISIISNNNTELTLKLQFLIELVSFSS